MRPGAPTDVPARTPWACGRYGHRTTAVAGGRRGGSSAALTAAVAMCTGVYHLSKRTTSELVGRLFGVDMADGND